METSTLAQFGKDRYARVAGPIHTIFLLVTLGAWSFLGWITAGRVTEVPNPHRIRLYLFTLFFEWLLFVYVVAGVRRGGASILIVVGNRWHSVRQLLRDMGIAAAFWVISGVLVFALGRLLRVGATARNIQFMLPHRAAEFAAWIALSVSAGICEEMIFRGYLQRQFIAMTRSAIGGIILSAAAFGAAHAYQGSRMMILIGLYGAMFGTLSHWRGSVRPGMIAHAWQDSLSGVLAAIVKH